MLTKVSGIGCGTTCRLCHIPADASPASVVRARIMIILTIATLYVETSPLARNTRYPK